MTDSPLFSFEKLRVYQLSKTMVGNIYRALNQFPKEENFALSSQLRRAAISIPSNIAEGSGRVSPKEQLHFVSIAYGSLMEVYCQLQISHDIGYINDETFNDFRFYVDDIGKLLSGLRKSLMVKVEAEDNPSLNAKH